MMDYDHAMSARSPRPPSQRTQLTPFARSGGDQCGSHLVSATIPREPAFSSSSSSSSSIWACSPDNLIAPISLCTSRPVPRSKSKSAHIPCSIPLRKCFKINSVKLSQTQSNHASRRPSLGFHICVHLWLKWSPKHYICNTKYYSRPG